MDLVNRIIILVSLQITLIITSFLVIVYFESQTNLTGNIVNVAGKNRLLASMVQVELNRALLHNPIRTDGVFDALEDLRTNIYFVKHGGMLSGVEISPLPSRFDGEWNSVADKFEQYNNTISTLLTSKKDALHPEDVETAGLMGTNLVELSDTLTEKLGRDVEDLSAQLMFMQASLGAVNAVTHIFMIALIWRIFRVHTEQKIRAEKFATIGKFSAMIAHDMRNPLGAINNSTSLIQNYELPPQVDNEIRRINRAIRRMSHQIEGVLNYVRTITISPEPKPVLEMLNRSIDTITVPDNIRINLPAGKDDLVIRCDPEKMGFVFANLLLNAIQEIGSDSHGHITVRIHANNAGDGTITIEFENSGFIHKKDISHVFEPLFTTKMQGTGLGLVSCKNIIERHNGTIVVSSNGGLVTFTICLPRK